MRDVLRRQIESACREELGAAAIHRLCPDCGSSEHGRPSIWVEQGRAPYVSWSYAEDLAVLAWTWAGPIGVDVLSIGDQDVDRAEDHIGLTRTGALHKATGQGGAPDLTQPAPVSPTAHWAVPLDLPAGYVGHAVVLGMPDGPPQERPTLDFLVVPA